LEASTRVFAVKGYAGATNDEIAEAAGVSASVYFRHFRTKGELFREALVQPFVDSLTVFTERWRRSWTDPVDEEQMMRDFITDVYDNLAAHPEALRALVTTGNVLDERSSDEVAQLLNGIFDRFHEMGQREADRRGWFPGDDMELNSRLITAMLAGAVAYRDWLLPTGRNRISRRKLVEHMSNLMLYGLRLGPPPADDDARPPTIG
jgi:AcrR family transcriptional regulator